MKRNIQELLSIKFGDLYGSAKVISAENRSIKKSDEVLLLNLELSAPFQDMFTEMRIRCFKGVATHLMFNSYVAPKAKLYPLINCFVDEYGPDQNGFTTEDWKGNSHYSLGWGFSNQLHEPAYDNSDYKGNCFYSFSISKPGDGTIELSILDYKKLDSLFVGLNDEIIQRAKAHL